MNAHPWVIRGQHPWMWATLMIGSVVAVTALSQHRVRRDRSDTGPQSTLCASCGTFANLAYDLNVSPLVNEWYYALRIELGKAQVSIDGAWDTIETIRRDAIAASLSSSERRLVGIWITQASIDAVSHTQNSESRRLRWAQTVRDVGLMPLTDRPNANELHSPLGWTSLYEHERRELTALITHGPIR